ncbi:hypothetical protein [Nostoc sp.]|uniref:hypothetical protein n=1 Tax=Nostoc sp. TaxID=1180 RepID=UPI002FF65001
MNTLFFQVQLEMLHLCLLCSESEVKESELIVPSIASMAALRKVALHKKFGGGKI